MSQELAGNHVRQTDAQKVGRLCQGDTVTPFAPSNMPGFSLSQ